MITLTKNKTFQHCISCTLSEVLVSSLASLFGNENASVPESCKNIMYRSIDCWFKCLTLSCLTPGNIRDPVLFIGYMNITIRSCGTFHEEKIKAVTNLQSHPLQVHIVGHPQEKVFEIKSRISEAALQECSCIHCSTDSCDWRLLLGLTHVI